MTDITLFAAGWPFTHDYLEDAIARCPAWANTDSTALHEALASILDGFPY